MCRWRFNLTKFPMERNRNSRLTSTMRRFSKIIKELKLRDLPLQGDFHLEGWFELSISVEIRQIFSL